MSQNYMDEIRKYQANQGQNQPLTTPSFSVSGASATTLSGFLSQVYTWMTLGLALTGFVAFASYSTGLIYQILTTGRFAIYALMIVEVGLVIAFGALMKRASVPVLAAMLIAYAALNGVTLSVLLLVFTGESVISTFFITAAAFGGLALYGVVTKRDLSGVGSFMMMGLIGLIVCSIVNIFLKSSALSWTISLIGVGVFAGLAAWDSQKLKAYYAAAQGDETTLRRFGLAGALSLYLDFVNLFIHLLQLLGRKK